MKVGRVLRWRRRKRRCFVFLGRHGFHVVLALLFALMVVQPWADETEQGRRLVLFTYVSVLVGSFVSLARSRVAFVLGLLIGVPGILLSAFRGWGYELTGLLLTAAFMLLVTLVIGQRVFTARRVTGVMVSGSVCIYLMLGSLWALLYFAVESFDPGAAAFASEGVVNRQTAFYFSFVTLTTLGYGDVTPVDPVARSLATVEALVGQLYLVVMVARLVALHIAHERE